MKTKIRPIIISMCLMFLFSMTAVSAAVVPTTPTNFAAQVNEDCSITGTWDAQNGVSKYDMQYASNGAFTPVDGTVTVNAPTTTATTPELSTATWYLRVRSKVTGAGASTSTWTSAIQVNVDCDDLNLENLDPEDTIAPMVTITAPINGGYFTSVTLPALSYTVTDDLDPNPMVNVDGWSDAEGMHTVTVTATDAAGNVGSASVMYTVDNTAPMVTINEPMNGSFYQTVTLPSLDYTATDNLDPSPMVNVDGWSDVEGVHTVTVTATDAAGNVGSASVMYTIDNTAPEITITTPADGASYILNQNVLADWSAVDALSGIDSVSATTAVGEAIDTTLGTKTYTVTATDLAGNSASKTVEYYVKYNFGGLLPPIKTDGTSVFKRGSTIPVKFKLTDANNVFVSTAVAKAYVSTDGGATWLDGVSTSSAVTGNFCRYDSVDNQYIFNLATKGLPLGQLQVKIVLDDGAAYYATVTLK